MRARTTARTPTRCPVVQSPGIVPYPRRVGFGIDRRARSRKGKGLFRRAPDPKEVGNRLGWLLRRMDRRATTRTRLVDDRFVADVRYHDAAPAAKLVVGAD